MEIIEFQRLMQELYAHNDRKRGGKATILCADKNPVSVPTEFFSLL